MSNSGTSARRARRGPRVAGVVGPFSDRYSRTFSLMAGLTPNESRASKRAARGHMAVSAEELAEALAAEYSGESAGPLLDVTNVAQECRPGFVYTAISGLKTDGNRFVAEAVSRGAEAIVSEKARPEGSTVAWLRVADARLALAQTAAQIFGNPSHELKLVGVTGTNGKTTTAFLVDSLIRSVHGNSAMIGTIVARIGEEQTEAARTTPEAPVIQRLLRRAVDAGVPCAVMEVSSHAIDLKRVSGCRYDVAVFTNLTQDHLDYHKTLDEYFAVKLRLFSGAIGSAPRVAVVNLDDPRSREIVQVSPGEILTYSLQQDASVRAEGYSVSLSGIRYTARTAIGSISVSSPLVGRPNVYNTLAAIAVGQALGFSREEIERGINGCENVPGRFERVPSDAPFAVVVDYAHTDDALRNTLKTARELARARVITLFGCGGDRDRTKRPLMAEAAARFSDVVILTSDNPRSEDPKQILRDAEEGLLRVGKPFRTIEDRREAIFAAISEAKEGDIVILAGKGHEAYQIVGDQVFTFDDREVAREALKDRGARLEGAPV